MTKILNFLRDESGATAIEYSLILGLVVLAIVGAITSLEGAVSNLFDFIAGEVNNSVAG